MLSPFKLKRTCYPLSALLGVMMSSSVVVSNAALNSPDQVLHNASDQMIGALVKQRHDLQHDPDKVIQLVEKILVPHIDVESATRNVLGQHWRDMNIQQRQRFTNEFKNLLVRFYSVALTSYLKDYALPENIIEFMPFKALPDQRKVMVHTLVHPDERTRIKVIYLVHQVQGQWKVYDVLADGISIVGLYHAVFASELRGKNIDELITSLQNHNKQLQLG